MTSGWACRMSGGRAVETALILWERLEARGAGSRRGLQLRHRRAAVQPEQGAQAGRLAEVEGLLDVELGREVALPRHGL